ncbi:MAG: AAA family ATPase [Clostridia bacterium]|nr:AAA family ATPase [Clostridia bacterium]
MDWDDIYNYFCDDDDDDDDEDEDDMDIPFGSGFSVSQTEIKPMGKDELNVSFDDVYGYENVKAALLEICDIAKNSGKYTRMGIRMPHGVMLSGAPGVGKTMMAKAMIHELDRPAFLLRKVQADSAFLGIIGKVFDEAQKNAPSIIFLDDLDKFSKGKGCTNEFAAVQAGIDSVQTSDVLVIATVNEKHRLPDALCRPGRFDRIIHVSLPGAEESAVIIGRLLAGKKISQDVNMKTVAKLLDGYTCVALDSVLNEAGLSDVYELDSITVISPEKKVGTAYHEAGHAAASMLLRPGSVPIASVRTGQKGTDGFVQTLRDEDDSYEAYCGRIIMGLAGRAATELRFGDTDMGAAGDIGKAVNMCDILIREICAKGLSNETEDLRGQSDTKRSSLETQRSVMLEDFYQEAKKLLRSNWDLVERLAQALIEKETIICADLDAIYADYVSGKGAKGSMIPAGGRRAA